MLQVIITVGGVTKNYSKYVQWETINVNEQLNIPSTMTFSMTPSDSLFTLPPQRAYVALHSTKYNNSLFTGFISTQPTRNYLGLTTRPLGEGGQLFRYDITCTSDEYLLNVKAVPFVPDYINRTQGEILSDLTVVLFPPPPASGFFDVSNVASGDIVAQYHYDPQQAWAEVAKKFGDATRYRYKGRDKAITYQPFGDGVLGINYDESLPETTFTAKDLQTTILNVPIVNDVTIIGDAEAGNNWEDYFVGDGFTGDFALHHKVFHGASTLLLQESWSNTELNTQQWFLSDAATSAGDFDFSAGALNIVNNPSGPVLTLGTEYLEVLNGIELSGQMNFEVGEVTFNDYCDGVLGGLYQDPHTTDVSNDLMFTAPNLVGGFRITSPSGVVMGGGELLPPPISGHIGVAGVVMQPWWNTSGSLVLSTRQNQIVNPLDPNPLGMTATDEVTTLSIEGASGFAIGPPIVSQVNHNYVLQMMISAPVFTRYNRFYRTVDGEEFGGLLGSAIGNVTFAIQDYDIAAATGFYYQPAVSYSVIKNVPIAPFLVYALVNNKLFNLTITNTTIAALPLGTLQGLLGASGLAQPSGLILPALPPGSGQASEAPIQIIASTAPLVGQPITITTSVPHGYTTDDIVLISNNSMSTANGTFSIIVTTPTQFVLQGSFAIEVAGAGGTASRQSGGFIGTVQPWNSSLASGIFQPPGPLNTVETNLVMGNGFQLQAAQVKQGNSADTLGFYNVTLPAAGTRIRYQSWEQQAAVSRLQDQASITGEIAVVGDNGLRSAIVTDLNPLPRTSEDCDNAALAFLMDRTGIFYNGTYQCTSMFFVPPASGDPGAFQFYPTVGRFFHVNSPSRGIVAQKYLVTQLGITVLDAPTELVQYNVTFGADLYLEKVLHNFVDILPPQVLTSRDTTHPPNPRFTQNVGTSFIPDLNHVMAESFGITDTSVTLEVADPYFGPIEVRKIDNNWGRGGTRDYVGTFFGPTIVLPRLQFDQTWYMRPVAPSGVTSPSGVIGPSPSGFLTSRRSKAIHVHYPFTPLNPSFKGQNGSVLQFDFTGDIRNIYGFEIRAFQGDGATPLTLFNWVQFGSPQALGPTWDGLLDADQWNYYYAQFTLIPQHADLFTPGNRFQLIDVVTYFNRRAAAGLPSGALNPQAVIVVQKPVASFADLTIDLAATPFNGGFDATNRVSGAMHTAGDWWFEAFFWNVLWHYSVPTEFIIGPTGGPKVEFGIPADFTVGTQTLNTQIKTGFTISRVKWNLSADLGESPGGANAVFDIQKSSDNGTTWTSIFPPSPLLKLLVHAAGFGFPTFGEIGEFAIPALKTDDWVKVVCLSGGISPPGKGLQGAIW